MDVVTEHNQFSQPRPNTLWIVCKNKTLDKKDVYKWWANELSCAVLLFNPAKMENNHNNKNDKNNNNSKNVYFV